MERQALMKRTASFAHPDLSPPGSSTRHVPSAGPARGHRARGGSSGAQVATPVQRATSAREARPWGEGGGGESPYMEGNHKANTVPLGRRLTDHEGRQQQRKQHQGEEAPPVCGGLRA